MKRFFLLLIVTALSLLCVAQEKSKTAAKPQPGAKPKTAEKQAPLAKANPEFERLKQLVGRWEGKAPDGKTAIVTYRLSSGGSALLNTMFPGSPEEMLTVFYPDGNKVMGTHYCSMQNQPRFVAEPSPDPKVMTFKFKDITNLASADTGHIEGLVITFTDADHHTEQWISRAKGKVEKVSFELSRVKK